VAGDMPRLSTLSLQSLLSLRKPEIQAIVARDEEGRIHPLVGCYHRSVQPAVRQCIEEHVFAVKALISQIEKIEYVTLPTEDLANINRPGDLATYR
jgi:molybdopterin-guanine dinucleotide biosynthesis protein A